MTEKLEGIINLDKPAGVTSARMVGRVKRLLPRGTKIGHAGTLDPFATGVLLLLVGKATKSCERLMDSPKQYDATVRLGATTETDDLEGTPTPWPGLDANRTQIDPADLPGVLASFVGEIMQKPPAFSALKVGGRRSYDLARKGAAVELPARPVKVYGIELLAYDWPELKIRVDCGRGTYIRSLARDIGKRLNAGGYLTALRRAKVGPFNVNASVTIERLTTDGVAAYLLPVPQPENPPASVP